jgi:hypothetical protein
MHTPSIVHRLALTSVAGLAVLVGCGANTRSGTVAAVIPTMECAVGGTSTIDGAPLDAKRVVFTWTTSSGDTTFEFTRFTAGSRLEAPTPVGATRVDAKVLDKAGRTLTTAGASCGEPTIEPPLPTATDVAITVGGSPDTTKP